MAKFRMRSASLQRGQKQKPGAGFRAGLESEKT